MTPEQLVQFLGWNTLINLIVFAIGGIAVLVYGKELATIHARWFGMDEEKLPAAYFQYLGRYKTLIFFFNLVPYLALRIMGV